MSVWLDTTPVTGYEALAENSSVDVVVAGGGIAGLVTAYFLMREGLKVAVVEAMRIVEDVTGYTTGKVTFQHGQLCRLLTETLGVEKARIYAQVNQEALEQIVTLIDSNNIDCDFRRADSYLYTEIGANRELIRVEVEAAKQLGIPADFVEQAPLPFVRYAMRFKNQAQFHPRKFLLFLAHEIAINGGVLFENTRALDIVETGSATAGVVLKTDRGDISAAHVIVATNTPFYHRELFAPLFTPTRSFVLGLRLEGPVPDGLYYSIDPAGGSIRNQPLSEGKLLMVGCWDRTLGPMEFNRQFELVESYSRKRLPVASIDYHWFTQDQKTPDRVPCIGRLPGARNVLMAAGFGGWGMTTSCAAAMLLADLVMERDNTAASLFDPARLFGG